MASVSILAGLLFGVAPAFASARADLNATIKEGGRSGAASRAGGRTRAALVIAEIALSLMLLVGAGLLLRSFANLQRVTGGLTAPPRQILTMLISPGNRKYRDSRAGLAFYDEVLNRARALPGVEADAVTDSLAARSSGRCRYIRNRRASASARRFESHHFSARGQPGFLPGARRPADQRPLLYRSRQPGFGACGDRQRRFRDAAFSHQEAIGQRVKQSGPGYGDKWMDIVGVVGNVKYLGLTVDTDPALYIPFAQSYSPQMFIAVRSTGDAGALTAALRQDIQSIDPGVTLAQNGTMEQALDLSVSQPRFDTMLLSSFAGIALLLAAVGIYGLIAYSVAQRTHEIGVRMALGADQADVFRMVVRQSAALATLGIVLGLGGAFVLTRWLRTMLFGIAAADTLTFVAAPLVIMLVVLLATFVPALRATRISPVVALRYE